MPRARQIKGFIGKAINPFFIFFTKAIEFFQKLHIIKYIGFSMYKKHKVYEKWRKLCLIPTYLIT